MPSARQQRAPWKDTVEATPELLADAVHRHSATSRKGVLERLFTRWFNDLVYNQIWEDPVVDAGGLRLGPGDRVLSISSGGCNLLNYLLYDPDRVVGIDLNRSQLALTRLKLTALQQLPSHETFYRFFGVGESEENVRLFDEVLRPHLDEPTRSYWEETPGISDLWGGRRIEQFARGFYDRSRLGVFLRAIHSVAETLGYEPDRLLQATSREEQEVFFEEVVAPFFDNRLVRWITGRTATVFNLGIPPRQHALMAEEANGDVVELYKKRIRKLACGFPIRENYFAWQAFGRRYDHEHREAVPPYLQNEHFDVLNRRLDRIETHQSSLTGYLSQQSAGSFTGFALLDAQDWMDPLQIRRLWTEIGRVGMPGARVVFRTAGSRSPVEEILQPALRKRFSYEKNRSARLHEEDRSAIYGMFHVYKLCY